MKQKKNPFVVNLSIEYLHYIWSVHFKKWQFNAAEPQQWFVYTQEHNKVLSEGLLKKS